ncbi:MAG: ABC transporter permease, partial [Cellulomonadaceae bacterium]|nr:ABC transporter permease [Cellulomonadaceae bacterium]
KKKSIIRREAIGEALIPSLDQTRTVGLVTLPGTFVGALFGGASPLDAGIFQVIVLTAILTAGAITATLLLSTLAAIHTRPTIPVKNEK